MAQDSTRKPGEEQPDGAQQSYAGRWDQKTATAVPLEERDQQDGSAKGDSDASRAVNVEGGEGRLDENLVGERLKSE